MVLDAENLSGEVFQDDLVGCSLIGKSGEDYGKVKRLSSTARIIARTQGASKEFLVPFTEKLFLK